MTTHRKTNSTKWIQHVPVAIVIVHHRLNYVRGFDLSCIDCIKLFSYILDKPIEIRSSVRCRYVEVRVA